MFTKVCFITLFVFYAAFGRMIENTKEEDTIQSEEKDAALIDNIEIEKEDHTSNLILKFAAFEKLFNLRLIKITVYGFWAWQIHFMAYNQEMLIEVLYLHFMPVLPL